MKIIKIWRPAKKQKEATWNDADRTCKAMVTSQTNSDGTSHQTSSLGSSVHQTTKEAIWITTLPIFKALITSKTSLATMDKWCPRTMGITIRIWLHKWPTLNMNNPLILSLTITNFSSAIVRWLKAIADHTTLTQSSTMCSNTTLIKSQNRWTTRRMVNICIKTTHGISSRPPTAWRKLARARRPRGWAGPIRSPTCHYADDHDAQFVILCPLRYMISIMLAQLT